MSQGAAAEVAKAGSIKSVEAATHSVEISAYSGPLPHPDILRQYEDVVPGSAALIIKQFEEQSRHRRSMEAKVISSGTFSQRIGTVTAAVIGIGGVAGGLWLAQDGKGVDGLATLFGTLASLIAVFL